MKKVIEIVNLIIVNAPKVKYYANFVIHVVDMLDGVQDWQKVNKPEEAKAKK